MNTIEEAITHAGLPSTHIPSDGKIHRFGKKKECWAVNFGPAGAFGDWSKGEQHTWSNGKDVTDPEVSKKIEEVKLEAAEETRFCQEKAAKETVRLWKEAHIDGYSQYLQMKMVRPYGVRFSQGSMLVPLHDIDGNLCSLQFIHEDGTKRFLPGGKKKGCFHIMGELENSKRVYVCEGYATGASIHEATEATTVIAFDSSNIEPVVASMKNSTTIESLQIIIAADNDQYKEPNIGKIKAEEAAKIHGCDIIFPSFSEDIIEEYKPTDFNDLHLLVGLEEVKTQLESIPYQPTKRKQKDHTEQGSAKKGKKEETSSCLTLKENGLYSGDEWVCAPINLLAYTRDEYGANWGCLVSFKDRDGLEHKMAIPMEVVNEDVKELATTLTHHGLDLCTKRSNKIKLANHLQRLPAINTVLCTSRIGWHKECFILPDGAIPKKEDIYLQNNNTNNFTGFDTKGTLEEWKEHVAMPCRGNTRLILSLCCAFAAPLLSLLNKESGGFNLKGESSIGKSTALSVAASVWGSPKYIKQWRATGNALEAVAEARNNALLCLDELSQVNGREAGEIAYMIANESGKSRMKAKGGLRRQAEWNLLFLSTGEISIVDKLNEVGKKLNAGMLTRMVDIPAEASDKHLLFDTIHGFKDGAALSNHLKEATANYYGTAIRAFLEEVVTFSHLLPEMLEATKAGFFKDYVDEEAHGQVQRVALRFAILALAGELATKYNILPLDRTESYIAMGRCFKSWLEERGSMGSHEAEEAIKQVQSFIEAHHGSRFPLMFNDITTTQTDNNANMAGYKRKTIDNQYEFFVFPHVFRQEMCKGFDPKMVCKELYKRRYLIRSENNRFVKTQRLPIGLKRIYHLCPSILTEIAM